MAEDTAGDPCRPLKWKHKSSYRLSAALGKAHPASPPTVRRLLDTLDYSRKVNRKELALSSPHRNEQFEYRQAQKQAFIEQGWPVIYVDTKKRELIGLFKNAGTKWCRDPHRVNVYDFRSLAEGIAIPYGIYDSHHNAGSVYVGTSADTAEVSAILALLCFAVPAWIAQQIIARAFYARADTLRPMLLGTVVAIASIPLYLELGQSQGVRGLAIASAIGMTVSAVATLVWARWLHGAPALSRLVGTTARAVLVAVPAALLVRWLLGAAPSSTAAALVDVTIGTALFAALAGGGSALIGDDAMREMLRRLARRARLT